MLEKADIGQEEAGKEGCKKGGMKERRDAGNERSRK